ncbi:hypothetical protein [Aquimarina macrocephali]|uniref:hypothetical protein n=1 Tax=Aquimarina macrocephali TaxID=666563 RepID=UPI003F669858
MNISIRFIGILFSCFCSCKSLNDEKERQIEESSILSDDKVVILLNSDHNKWLHENYGYQKWEPKENEIISIQEIIDKAIKNEEFDFLKKPIKESLNKYYKQYIPYINKKGEKVIEINAFCEILEIPPLPESKSKQWTKMDWKNEYVMVDDGGTCYWQITINIDKKTYENLMVNGVG